MGKAKFLISSYRLRIPGKDKVTYITSKGIARVQFSNLQQLFSLVECQKIQK